ncbi:CRE-SULP-4 protein [Aphelenchoides avenae]|nr:CRE-SULP-4 protein [Aphelenchus avenae]
MSQDAEDGPELLFPGELPSSTLRRPMNQEEFDALFSYSRPRHRHSAVARRTGKCLRRYYRPFLSPRAFLQALTSFVPIIHWLPSYSWKKNIVADVIGGLTVGIMHVPQGIAYAGLANLNPTVGLYTSFFPPLFYMLFGTSRHSSIGSFAVVSLMTGMTVREFSRNGTGVEGTGSDASAHGYDPVTVSCTLALCVGLIQILMGLLRLEIITTYFSDQLVAGFTTGASCHVLVAQLPELFGIPKARKEFLFQKVVDLVEHIGQLNWVTTGLGFGTIVFLVAGKEFVGPFVKKKFKSPVPVPFELLAVIIGTVIARILHLHSRHGVNIVSHIETGIPPPAVPDFSLIPKLFPSALSIAVVVVAVHISLSKMFAKRLQYTVDSGQELYALGITASLSSFFPVYPVSCSLGRTIVNVEAGTKTQFSTVFSSILLAGVIVYLGQLLRTLPMCVLSAIILVALKGMFKKLADLRTLWPLSKIDYSIWLVSFLATVCWDVTPGLGVAIVYALMTTVFRAQWPRWHFLGNLKGTNDFRDSERYKETIDHHGICIFRFDSPLLFTNVERFKANIYKALAKWEKQRRPHVLTPRDLTVISPDKDPNDFANGGVFEKSANTLLYQHFVIDCSGFTFVDYMGVNALKEIFTELKKERVIVYFAAAKAPVRDLFEKSGFYKYVPKHNFYPTIRDAVAIARKRRNASTMHILEEFSLPYDKLDETVSVQPMN